MKSFSNVNCFVINQLEKKERLKNINKLLNKLNFKIINVVNPFKADKNSKNILEKKINKKLNTSFNQVSHFLTYLSILEKNDVDDIFIFEDDIIQLYENDEYIKDKLLKIVNDFPKDAHMIYLEFCFENCNKFSEDKFTRLNNPSCTAAIYFPSLKKRLELVNIIKENINDKCIKYYTTDNIFGALIEIKKINAYTIKPLFVQDRINFASNIQGSLNSDFCICKNIKENFTLPKKSKKNIIILIIIIIILIISFLVFIKL